MYFLCVCYENYRVGVFYIIYVKVCNIIYLVNDGLDFYLIVFIRIWCMWLKFILYKGKLVINVIKNNRYRVYKYIFKGSINV